MGGGGVAVFANCAPCPTSSFGLIARPSSSFYKWRGIACSQIAGDAKLQPAAWQPTTRNHPVFFRYIYISMYVYIYIYMTILWRTWRCGESRGFPLSDSRPPIKA